METHPAPQHLVQGSPKATYQTVVGALCYAIIGATTLFNLGAIIIILCTAKLLKTPKYITIINLGMVMLILGLFVLMGQHANYVSSNASLYYYTNLFQHLAFACILSLSVVLNVDYIMRIVKPAVYEGNRRFALLAVLLLIVYVINSLLIIPLYLDTYVLVPYLGTYIYERTNPHHELIIVILSVVPQTVFLLLTAIMAIIVYAGYRKSQLDTPIPAELIVRNTLVLLLADIPVALKIGAPSIFTTLPPTIAVWLVPYLIPVLLPLSWLLERAYRNSLRDFILCRCRKSRDSDSYEMM